MLFDIKKVAFDFTTRPYTKNYIQTIVGGLKHVLCFNVSKYPDC